MKLERSAGILLHPTSLPGPYGLGDLGPDVDLFLDWLAAAGQGWWQVLPLGPPQSHDSPYNSLSAFAGNPLLISPELLHRDGLLQSGDLAEAPVFAARAADFARVGRWKEGLLRRAWERFQSAPPAALRDELEHFRGAPEQAAWLDDWVLFSALREHFGGLPWSRWDKGLAERDAAALAAARAELAPALAYHAFVQLLFMRQWQGLREAASRRRIRLLGDLPIYLAEDSADVWAHRELFDLDEGGRPRTVAGVPPDYFSATGQLWGNPLYRWDRIAATGYRWWTLRLRHNLRLTDAVRLDHFRGFAAFWEVPAGEATAIGGRWVPGPGRELFAALQQELGDLPLVAEDLGDITPDVEALRCELGLPGMRVLQFGFDDAASPHVPHRFVTPTVVYTGTHDNDTLVGWYRHLAPERRQRVRDYAGGGPLHWALIRLAYTSIAELAILPMQDVLGLGSVARMNVPGRAEGNWSWRLLAPELRAELAGRLRRLAEISGRLVPAVNAAS